MKSFKVSGPVAQIPADRDQVFFFGECAFQRLQQANCANIDEPNTVETFHHSEMS